jgi:hypothetical protein
VIKLLAGLTVPQVQYRVGKQAIGSSSVARAYVSWSGEPVVRLQLGFELPAIMKADRWKNDNSFGCYTSRLISVFHKAARQKLVSRNHSLNFQPPPHDAPRILVVPSNIRLLQLI